MISKYNSFLEDSLFENVINESIIYFSPNLRRIISGVTNKIGDELINIEGVDIKPDITFLDLDKEGYLSFTTMRNATNLVRAKFPDVNEFEKISNKDLADGIWKYDISNDDLGVYKKSRSQIKIGKLVNKLFPGKFTDKEIEEFVNNFKAKLEKQGEKFEIVEGDAISFWYNSDNYKEKSGSLGNSCMASKSNIFQLYTMNPEVCRLVILLEDEELIGRALLWKINSINKGFEKDDGEGFSKDFKPEYFMDRQYTIKDSDVDKFRNYAKENGWSYKSYNNHHSLENVSFLSDVKRVNMTVTLKPYKGSDFDYNKYPYLDTFRRYDPGTGYLYNDNNDDSDYSGNYLLDSTEGRYTEIERGVYSEWCDCMIDEETAVYSDPIESYIRRDDAIVVNIGDRRHRGYWPEGHDDIVYDDDREEYIHIDNAVRCELDSEFIYKDDATLTVSEIDGIEDDYSISQIWMRDEDNRTIDISVIEGSIWFEKLSENNSDWGDCTQILKKLLTRDFNNKWIPKQLSMSQYKVSDVLEDEENSADLKGIEYLSFIDALALGYSINLRDSQEIDIFSYNENISTLIESLKIRMRKKFNELEYKLSGKQLSIVEDPEYKSNLLKRRNAFMFRLDELDS